MEVDTSPNISSHLWTSLLGFKAVVFRKKYHPTNGYLKQKRRKVEIHKDANFKEWRRPDKDGTFRSPSQLLDIYKY